MTINFLPLWSLSNSHLTKLSTTLESFLAPIKPIQTQKCSTFEINTQNISVSDRNFLCGFSVPLTYKLSITLESSLASNSTYLVSHWILYPIGPIQDPLCPKYPILTLLVSISLPVTCSLTNPMKTCVSYHLYNT